VAALAAMLGALNGWSWGELATFLVVMLLALVALRYNRATARFFANLTGGYWPPGGLIREDRPERIQEQRELNSFAVASLRWAVILFSLTVFAACVVVLVEGPG
jgi:hypothetical protein